VFAYFSIALAIFIIFTTIIRYYVGGDIVKSLRDSEGYVLNCPPEVPPNFRVCSPDAKPGSPCLSDKVGKRWWCWE
jgi:hypothetical protein